MNDQTKRLDRLFGSLLMGYLPAWRNTSMATLDLVTAETLLIALIPYLWASGNRDRQ